MPSNKRNFAFAIIVVLMAGSFVVFQNFSNQGASISVDSYGARADGVTDSTAAFQAAINAATYSNGAIKEINLSAGTYLLKCSNIPGVTPVESLEWPLKAGATPSPYPEILCLNIYKASHISIKGKGAGATQLLIENQAAGLVAVTSSDDISLSDFSVDHSKIPFTQGVIQSVNKNSNYIDVALDAGYPALDNVIFSQKYFPQMFAVVMEPVHPRLKDNTKGYFVNMNFARNANGTWRVNLEAGDNWALATINAGDRFALPLRVSSSFLFYRSSDITLKNVTIYSGPGAASIWAENYGRLVIDGFQVRRKPGTNRLVSTAADAIHMANNKAQILIQNSYIEGMCDDAINIYNSGMSVTSIGNGAFNTSRFDNPIDIGQTVQLSNPNTSATKGEGKLVYYDGKINLNSSSMALSRDLYAAVKDTVFIEELASPGAVIYNNTFSSFRGHFRLRSAGAVFAKNSILDIENAKILVDSDSYWKEGPSLLYDSNKMLTLIGNYVPNGSLQLIDYYNKPVDASLSSRSQYLNAQVFDPKIYLVLNPDLAGSSEEYLKDHWVNYGIAEGRQASLKFYSRKYKELYPDMAALSHKAAMEHFLIHGKVIEKRTGSTITNEAIYSPDIYRELNPDLKTLNDTQLLIHWTKNGLAEGRQASYNFKARDYLEMYPDLKAAFGPSGFSRAIDHFLMGGSAVEKRSGTILMNPLVFNYEDYKLYNPDLALLTQNQLATHWLMHGVYEGRRATKNFSSTKYLAKYIDLAKGFGNNYPLAIRHYVLNGVKEGRTGN